MNLENEDSVPLAPLNELIRKFKERSGIMAILTICSLPASIVSIFVFFLLFAVIGFSGSSVIVFTLLLFSAGVSLIANFVFPSLLSGIVDQMETSVRSIAFTLAPTHGDNPPERILNQLVKTDYEVRKLVKKKPDSAQLNVKIAGKNGAEYDFDVRIHNRPSISERIKGASNTNVFVKRFDQPKQVSEKMIEEVKDAIENILEGTIPRVPTRVLVVSSTGFEDSVFEFVNSGKGIFRIRFPAMECKIELIKENVDNTFDALSF